MKDESTVMEVADAAPRERRDGWFEVAYPELRRLAHARLRSTGRHGDLATTALVHESYLRFLSAPGLAPTERAAFFDYASKVMRSVIIDSVRSHRAQRRRAEGEALTLQTFLVEEQASDAEMILEVHDALLALEAVEPRLAKVVEMHYFAGFSFEEIADALALNERTVRRDYKKASLLLRDQLKQ